MSEAIHLRVHQTAIEAMRAAIHQSNGQEVLFVGRRMSDGLFGSIEVMARGNEAMVAAPGEWCSRGDVVIHNHPSGTLRPSDADVQVSARLAEQGIGSAIVDNTVEHIYVLVEPLPALQTAPIDLETLSAVIESGGAMEQLMGAFLERPSQIRMLQSVARAFNDGEIAALEAGTGVGKSFAYLLPALRWAASNNERVVIATATINLQQQLIEHDIPMAQRALGTEVSVALVKGRGNYLCQRRLADQRQEAELFDDDSIAGIVAWSAETATGSRSDMPFFVPHSTWSKVNSESDSCSIARCPDREACFVLKARQRAAGARVLVANHHVVFSDIAVRRAGAGYEQTAVLPPFHRLIFDEAHNVEQAATGFFSESVSSFGVAQLAGRIQRRRGSHRFGLLEQLREFDPPDGLVDRARDQLAALRDEARDFNARAVAFLGAEQTWRLTPGSEHAFRTGVGDSFRGLSAALVRSAEALAAVARAIDDRFREEPLYLQFVAHIKRVEAAASVLESFWDGAQEQDSVFWLERRARPHSDVNVVAHVTPRDVSEIMRSSVLDPFETVVFTSATLAVARSFQSWGARLGLNADDERITSDVFESPFDYARRVRLAVPTDAPPPDSPAYDRYLVELVPRLVGASDGAALILFTSFRQLESVHAAVAPRLEQRGLSCYKQGDDDRNRLLGQFRTDVASCLFATDSFWEGVDIPGNALRLVILCRLPFRVPNDPVQQARSEAIERTGRSAFAEFSLPHAVTRLKQGFGRLMRTVDDHGVVVVTDVRMVTKSYGRVFWNSLPPAGPIVAPGEEIVEETQRFLSTFYT